jgi:cold-inducible RNA-binding protein
MDIYVGNLPYKAADQDLRTLFEEFGTVSSARVIMDKMSGQSKGFGFVEMPNQSEAQAAIQKTNGADLMGRSLRVNESRPREEGGGGRGPGGPGGGGGRDRFRGRDERA